MNRYKYNDGYIKPPLYFDDIGTCFGTAAQNDNYTSPHVKLIDGKPYDEYQKKWIDEQI